MLRLLPRVFVGALAVTGCADKGAETPLASERYTCQSDDECRMSCVNVNDCCPNPCGCDQVRHVREHELVQRQQIDSCKDAIEECPDVGACDPEHAYATPRCIEGACVGARTKDELMAQGTHRATINGAQLVYHVIGSGPPIVVLSGGPGARWEYLRLPDGVAERATLIHLELVGTGDSARLEDPKAYSLARDVADVLALREHLGLERIGVLGHSYGGFVAQQLALEHPGAVDRLVLYDTSPMNTEEMWTDVQANLQARASEPWFAEAAQALGAADGARTDEEINAHFAKMMPLYFFDWSAHEARAPELMSALSFSAARANLGTSTKFDFRTRLGEIRAPTLVLVGIRDWVCSPKLANMIHQGIPGARLVVFERSGHMAHIEEPKAFTDAVVGFLAGDPSGP